MAGFAKDSFLMIKWTKVTIGTRKVRAVVPDLEYLRLFEFHCYWPKGSGHHFRFDDFAILPAE